MEGFGFSSLATLCLGFNCDFISTSVYESSPGVYFSGCPGGLGSALGKTGGEVVWLLGLQGPWQYQVLREAIGYDSRKYEALRAFCSLWLLCPCGIELGSDTGAWIIGTLATPDTKLVAIVRSFVTIRDFSSF